MLGRDVVVDDEARNPGNGIEDEIAALLVSGRNLLKYPIATSAILRGNPQPVCSRKYDEPTKRIPDCYTSTSRRDPSLAKAIHLQRCEASLPPISINNKTLIVCTVLSTRFSIGSIIAGFVVWRAFGCVELVIHKQVSAKVLCIFVLCDALFCLALFPDPHP